MPQLTIPETIRKKRDGEVLSDSEIKFFVESANNGNADLSQIGAMLMAIYMSDLTEKETSSLTSCMVNSGVTLQWPGDVVDKHSTGGVGDKASLPLVPALAALGLTVPMVSGRGLGWTGGTLDKLESIPGYRVELTRNDMEKCIQEGSCFLAATTKEICPADKILYKIRDITSTVDNDNLIAASILSKKIAAGVDNLILDIKVGRGAFMKTPERAEQLANKMINVSKGFKMKTRALLTRMDSPIGMTIGNSLEIEESIETLLGRAPPDLLELIANLGGELMEMCGKAESVDEGKQKVKKVISDGSAMSSFLKMLLNHGVSPETAAKLAKGDYSDLPRSKYTTQIKSPSEGFIEDINALTLGRVSWHLGAGRNKPEDSIDPSVGLRLNKTIGDKVELGDVLITVHHNTTLNPQTTDCLINSFTLSKGKITPKSIVIKSVR